MLPQDVERLQQAIAFGQTAANKFQAHVILQELSRQYPDEPTVWLWLAYTSLDLGQAQLALYRVQRIDPANPALPAAVSWLNKEKERQMMPGSYTVASPPLTVTATPRPVGTPDWNEYDAGRAQPQTDASDRSYFPRSFSQESPKSWRFDLEDGKHTVEFGTLNQKNVNIYIDGSSIERRAKTGWLHNITTGTVDYPFTLVSHNCAIRVHSSFGSSGYELIIDGRSLKSGLQAGPISAMPVWAWLFVGLCILIPISSLGGLASYLIGFTGSGICSAVAREKRLPFGLRIFFCTLVSVACWVSFIFLLHGLANLRH